MLVIPESYGLRDEETEWARHYELPPAMNMMETHENKELVFAVQGTRMFKSIEACVQGHLGSNFDQMEILDFGCGVGRVALPCFYKYKKPSSCVDVDPACIAYLERVIPDAGPQTITFDPPAPFADETFDCIYAISVWTHLDPEASDRWMKEIIRILKPGGIALITTTNYPGLEARRQLKRDWVWKTVSDDDLRESGTIFHQHGATAGITGIYGNAAHDPEWLRREWSARYMPVVDIVSGGILGVQDINVMKRQERQ